MHIGHINLAESFNGAGEHFVRLIESLQAHGLQQHVLVRNVTLAKRLDLVDNVVVGPAVRSAITAYCLMPQIDVAHIHDLASRPAGLLLALTRSVPFVLTRQGSPAKSMNPLNQAACKRASGFIEENQIDVSEHIALYRKAADNLRIPNMIL